MKNQNDQILVYPYHHLSHVSDRARHASDHATHVSGRDREVSCQAYVKSVTEKRF